ncbi:MAG: cation:proton antiporter [Acidobacteriia bacterium]|nr:cation:proton antiporter [Terriglobia bacterium]
MNPVSRLMLQIVVILTMCWATGKLARLTGQTRVIGEIVAGILLGPSLFGWLAPSWYLWLFPPSSIGNLNVLSQIGLIIFLFVVGLNIDMGELRRAGHAVVLASHASITIPFFCGAVLCIYLYPRFAEHTVSFTVFTLFIGASMSITAFPVLARILSETGLMQTRLGTVAIACAAVDDVTGWCILAFIVILMRALGINSLLATIGGIAVFCLIMVYGVRPVAKYFQRIYQKQGGLSTDGWALLLILIMISAFLTERIGVHPLFGAFLTGAIMPKHNDLVRYLRSQIETIVLALLLPLFFAVNGLNTSITLIHGPGLWMWTILLILVATVGKMSGSGIASFLMGMNAWEAAGLGTLMNTRGLLELVILNIGLELKIISPTIFSMMVIMTLATTSMTTPVMRWMSSRMIQSKLAEGSQRDATPSQLITVDAGSGTAA